ncbi:MAG: hypothetical protein DHS80DRAFT_30633 [Piptocephalis tieghemiana]|nr:MAG: hypothetical protein DHS80DRAFT_30633 [Piptocephalis tieghemiana]
MHNAIIPSSFSPFHCLRKALPVLLVLWTLISFQAQAFNENHIQQRWQFKDGIFIPYEMTGQRGFLGILMMIFGLYFVFLGYRFLRLTLILTGYIYVAIIVMAICLNCWWVDTTERATLYLCLSLILGLIGAVIWGILYRPALFSLGSLAGIAVACWVNTLNWDGEVLKEAWQKAPMVLGFMLIGAILIWFFERPAVIGSTSFLGGYFFLLGVDMWIDVGMEQSAERVFMVQTVPFMAKHDGQTIGMLFGVLGFAVVGVIFQSIAFGGRTLRHPGWRERGVVIIPRAVAPGSQPAGAPRPSAMEKGEGGFFSRFRKNRGATTTSAHGNSLNHPPAVREVIV